MTKEKRHTDNITSAQDGRTVRFSCPCNKNFKTPSPHKKNKILLPTHIAHIYLPTLTQANTFGSQKSAISQRFIPPRILSYVHDKQTRIEGNKQRDLEIFSSLKNECWKVFTIFECELIGIKQLRTLNNILTRLNKFLAIN